ncbi:MAG: hypothetical protein ACRBB0_16845 [Pelagimonas sp.]|uniref:hypothetical protein n=1 Tax=Pelagimonas sp. TaxID=2073170 RepID=UPI003D6A5BB0
MIVLRKTSFKLKLILYPFVAAALAINLFMLFLLGQAVGLPVMPPLVALILALPLGIPANYMTAHWVQGLINEGEGRV